MNFASIGASNVSVVMVYEVEGGEGVWYGPISNGGPPGQRGFRVMALTPYVANAYEASPGDDPDYVLPGGQSPMWRSAWNTNWSVQQKAAASGKVMPTGPALEVWKSTPDVNGVDSLVWYYRDGKEVGVSGKKYSYSTMNAQLVSGTAWIGCAKSHMGGKIGEVMVYDRLLSEAERGQIEGYLNKRYGFTDEDGDGVPKWKELEKGLDPLKWDSNADGVKDGIEFEFAYGKGPNGELLYKTLDGSSNDVDGDGLTNEQEYLLGTNVFWNDTDGDGVIDGQDVLPWDPSESVGGGAGGAPVLLSIKSPSAAVITP